MAKKGEKNYKNKMENRRSTRNKRARTYDDFIGEKEMLEQMEKMSISEKNESKKDEEKEAEIENKCYMCNKAIQGVKCDNCKDTICTECEEMEQGKKEIIEKERKKN